MQEEQNKQQQEQQIPENPAPEVPATEQPAPEQEQPAPGEGTDADGGEGKEQPKVQTFNTQQAVEQFRMGRVMQLVDNGKGFNLPGVVTMPKTGDMLEFLGSKVVAPGLQIEAMTMLLVNIMPVSDKSVCIRFFSPSDFDANAVWMPVDTMPMAEVIEEEEETDGDKKPEAPSFEESQGEKQMGKTVQMQPKQN